MDISKLIQNNLFKPSSQKETVGSLNTVIDSGKDQMRNWWEVLIKKENKSKNIHIMGLLSEEIKS